MIRDLLPVSLNRLIAAVLVVALTACSSVPRYSAPPAPQAAEAADASSPAAQDDNRPGRQADEKAADPTPQPQTPESRRLQVLRNLIRHLSHSALILWMAYR